MFHLSHIDQLYSFRAESKSERYLLIVAGCLLCFTPLLFNLDHKNDREKIHNLVWRDTAKNYRALRLENKLFPDPVI